ncbi:MAG: ABC transporter ATP-binding protein, partial [Candidatus Marinimicrobia bacterium]|nr:ABC transporter ATP-binding protein [Candidatus Neomarinimicrobiota bacterium]
MNLLNLNKINFSYDELPTGNSFQLNISDFSLEAGESLAVTGNSGAGKTTFAKLLSGILKPSTGEFQILQKGMKIGMSFQFPENQFYLDTVLDDIVAGLLAKGTDEKEAISSAKEALEMVNLKPTVFGKRSHTTLSVGERRRAAIAILFSLNPDLYIIDEPT